MGGRELSNLRSTPPGIPRAVHKRLEYGRATIVSALIPPLRCKLTGRTKRTLSRHRFHTHTYICRPGQRVGGPNDSPPGPHQEFREAVGPVLSTPPMMVRYQPWAFHLEEIPVAALFAAELDPHVHVPNYFARNHRGQHVLLLLVSAAVLHLNVLQVRWGYSCPNWRLPLPPMTSRRPTDPSHLRPRLVRIRFEHLL